MEVAIAREDPGTDDVVRLLHAHLDHASSASPPDHVHALDLEGLRGPSIRFFAARCGTRLVGVGAIRDLGEHHAELKSMHTAEDARGKGVGRAMLRHLIDDARQRGAVRVSLETGTMAEFEPARKMYESEGFQTCEPFAAYTDNPFSVCMTLRLEEDQQ